VALLTKTVLTEEEKLQIRFIATELSEIRKQLLQLTETLAKISDKKFLEIFKVEKSDFTEKQVDKLELDLQKKVDAEENEFRY
jgi:hypothetical protein